jgi:tRNA wybutosine-synthesizing protein 4
MANILCQIRGTKRLLIFPPSDVRHFKFPPGASSSNVDIFGSLDDPQFADTHPHEVILHPGDVLFLPPLWLHSASPTEGVSVGVNVFFRNFDRGYAAGKDVYGNRDFHAYEKGRQDVARIGNSFNSLPADVRYFYLYRLAEELREKAGPIRN